MRNINCFFIMPYRPELNYFFLYVQKYLLEKHSIICERADEKVLTIPILEKIKAQIINSDFIIADISGKNPNVYYELGMSHTNNKKVLLITSDDIKDTPSDIRHYEFIKYDLDDAVVFLNRLDNAIKNLFIEEYQILFEQAIILLEKFNIDTKNNYPQNTIEDFLGMVRKSEKIQGIPDMNNEVRAAEFLLPKIVKNDGDYKVMNNIYDWVNNIGK